MSIPYIEVSFYLVTTGLKVKTLLFGFRCQNTIIGGALVRGISGGERKRVCIGNEILLNPSLLFLDEPTSGLDSTTALRILQMLQNTAEVMKIFP